MSETNMIERIRKLRELVERARDGFVSGSPYVLTYSHIIDELKAIEGVHECPTGDHDDCTVMLTEDVLRRIALRYKHCNVYIHPDLPELTPVEGVLRCAEQEGFILVETERGGR